MYNNRYCFLGLVVCVVFTVILLPAQANVQDKDPLPSCKKGPAKRAPKPPAKTSVTPMSFPPD